VYVSFSSSSIKLLFFKKKLFEVLYNIMSVHKTWYGLY